MQLYSVFVQIVKFFLFLSCIQNAVLSEQVIGQTDIKQTGGSKYRFVSFP